MSEAVASPSHGHAGGAALRLLGDDRLARRAASGDREAFAVLYQRHHQALYRYCRAILGNGEDAADALQNTMTAALRALSGERREIRVKPWLYRIAHNESVSLLRRRAPLMDLDAATHVAAPAGSDAETRERMRQLVADLRELPDRQRAALVMRELSGLGYDEIATTLESSQAATKQLVYEARAALHEMAEGRDMSCDSVRRSMSAEDRRILRGRRLRAHLRECAGCREFKETMKVRRRDLTAITPPLPALAAASLLQGLGGGGSGGGALAGLVSGTAGKAAATSAMVKGAATVAVVATVGAGAAGVTGNLAVPLTHKEAAPEAPAAHGVPAPMPGPGRGSAPRTERAGNRAGGGAKRRAAAKTRAKGPDRATRGAPRSRRPARQRAPGRTTGGDAATRALAPAGAPASGRATRCRARPRHDASRGPRDPSARHGQTPGGRGARHEPTARDTLTRRSAAEGALAPNMLRACPSWRTTSRGR